jgi:hypothetical protein
MPIHTPKVQIHKLRELFHLPIWSNTFVHSHADSTCQKYNLIWHNSLLQLRSLECRMTLRFLYFRVRNCEVSGCLLCSLKPLGAIE